MHPKAVLCYPRSPGTLSTGLAVLAVTCLLLAACVPLPATTSLPAAPAPRLRIYAPATPTSVPILLAAQRMADLNAQVTIFANHAQANAEFLRGDVDILVTGLSVGVELFKKGAPVQALNSYVAGMTYLVTRGKPVASFAELQGQEIYIPFEGSPIEETTQFLVEQAGLTWKRDVKPVYSPFASSVELLKQGRATAVALPEPFVSLIEGQPNLYISLSYRQAWDAATGTSDGYPQVTPFALREWVDAHPDVIARFNAEVAAALTEIQRDPAAAVAATHEALGLSAPVLSAALARTDFAFRSDDALAQEIETYYRIVGKPLDETFAAFPFAYRRPQ